MFESFAAFLEEWAMIVGAVAVVMATVYGAVKMVQWLRR